MGSFPHAAQCFVENGSQDGTKEGWGLVGNPRDVSVAETKGGRSSRRRSGWSVSHITGHARKGTEHFLELGVWAVTCSGTGGTEAKLGQIHVNRREEVELVLTDKPIPKFVGKGRGRPGRK